MVSASSLMDFLMNLLSDPDAKAEFENDPEGVLARNGLNQVCGQDVRDIGPLLADASGVSGTGRHGLHPGGDDPVAGIKYLTRHYTVEKDVTNNHYDINYVDDRDTANIHADGDLTIEDSFNQDNDFTVIEDSFNQDNDGVDNKGGTIDDSVVAGDDVTESGNSDDDVDVSNSHNTVTEETRIDASDDDTNAFSGSFNDADSHDVDADVGHPDPALAGV